MTDARRATVLVIAALAGATVAVWLTLATRPALSADDPQSFWRESTAVPAKAAGRARVMKRKHRHTHRTAAKRRPSGAAVGGAAGVLDRPPAAQSKFDRILPRGAVVLREAKASEREPEPSPFAERAFLNAPFETLRLLEPREQRPAPRKPRDNKTSKQLGVVAIVAAALIATLIAHRTIPTRGIA